jgi:hypothetical protein
MKSPNIDLVEMKLNKFEKKEGKTQANNDAKQAEISFQDVFDAAEIFEEDPRARSNDWLLARRFVDWKNLHNLSTTEIIERVIKFLDSWGCYLYTERENWPRMAEKIKEAYKKSIPFLNALQDETLEDLDLDRKRNVEGKEYTNKEILNEVFLNLSRVGYKFRGVAASKVLSLINPKLFMIWDQSICKSYGIRAHSEPHLRDRQYASEFLPIMRQKANDVIESCMIERRCSRKDAIEAINSFRKDRPLAKLLDEYNWITYYVDSH